MYVCMAFNYFFSNKVSNEMLKARHGKMSLNSMYTSNDVLGARQVKMSLNSMYTSIDVFMEFNDIFP